MKESVPNQRPPQVFVPVPTMDWPEALATPKATATRGTSAAAIMKATRRTMSTLLALSDEDNQQWLLDFDGLGNPT